MAESRYHTSGDVLGALNEVRRHRGIGDLGTGDLENFNSLLVSEFRKEIIGEGQLFWFYKRQNRTQIPSSKDLNNMITMEKSFYLFDLPQDEKDKRGVE